MKKNYLQVLKKMLIEKTTVTCWTKLKTVTAKQIY